MLTDGFSEAKLFLVDRGEYGSFRDFIRQGAASVFRLRRHRFKLVLRLNVTYGFTMSLKQKSTSFVEEY